MESKYYAVLTADIIKSTRLEIKRKNEIITIVKDLFEEIKVKNLIEYKIEQDFKIFQGDSFQGVINNPQESLRLALVFISKIRSMGYGLRIAIGVGTIDYFQDDIMISDGKAFHYSGRLLDKLKKDRIKIGVQTAWESINEELVIELLLLDALISKWTTQQSTIVYHKLIGRKEEEIGEIIKITQSAVNHRSKGASWRAIDELLKRYNKIINKQI